MFGIEQIVISAVVGAISSVLALYLGGRYGPDRGFNFPTAAALSLVVGLSILVYRLAANVQQLNDDPILLASPNDVLCPLVTYVALSVYAGLRSKDREPRFRRDRALLTLLSLTVNIITI